MHSLVTHSAYTCTWGEITFLSNVPRLPKQHWFLKVPRLHPFVFLVRATWRWISAWSLEEWYWQRKTEVLGKNPVSVPLCPTQISQGLAWYWTLDSALRGRWLTTWATTRPDVYCQLVNDTECAPEISQNTIR